ncbi:MobQ family relaxase [Enterococcus faecalis]|uniref:MobQ family relaxase n=1 Tax=Enterococcus cecorum TaxID=44008 RepID=UPI0022D4239B|nr:MobQ family relaxase [Enterococcus cecorum]EKZ0144256.1 MobA/MobL family protein [Enterococcus faecalis]CAI3301748.1 MobA/MobL family protein [Enterococcus cecorum]CAI3367801.1 MobA/MobL family protein [Enterococcus cecorum]CAI3376835.1 MobA/MobL family protein [Enterococcus cecorum]CAI3380788.1 MobA/MobL family protein [Enterococcus cecorum]
MAIYHFSMQVAKRENGKRSLIAMAAYRSGERLYSELYEKENYYGHRSVKPDAFILKPDYVPEEFGNREYLWNKMELAETSSNAQLCREVNIALPVELSNEDQKELMTKYVQKMFVSKGMIADVAIHRDDSNNPHVHIMLTMRKVDENGQILNKRKRVLLLDEHGKQVYNEKGHRKTVSIKTTDWDKKELLLEARKEWANVTNKLLRERGINEQITDKSHKELGRKELPTIHEGVLSRKLEERGIVTDQVKHNQLVREHNQSVQKLNNLEEKKELLIDQEQQPTKQFYNQTFSPMEKKELKALAKELRFFVSSENLEKRLDELKRWENSLLFGNKKDIQTQRLQLSRISDEREKIQQAEEILTKQAVRFCQKHYPELQTEDYSPKVLQAIVAETIDQKELLTKEMIEQLSDTESMIEQAKEYQLFKDQPFQTTRFLEEKIQTLTDQMNEPTTSDEERAILQIKINQFESMKDNLNQYVNDELEELGIKLDSSTMQGEMILAYLKYYQVEDHSIEVVDGLPLSPYSIEERNQMLEVSRGIFSNIPACKQLNDCHGVYFIQDCMQDLDSLSPLAQSNLKRMIEKNRYLAPKDKELFIQDIEEQRTERLTHYHEQTILYRLTAQIQSLLGRRVPQKKRNMDRWIRETKSKDKQQRELQERYQKRPKR